jgi:hypothetical protein
MRARTVSMLLAAVLACLLVVGTAPSGLAANKETIETVEAYSGEQGVRVEVFGHNEVGLLEYFNLIVFDDTKLDYVSIEADRGVLWYGAYPTYVDGNKIYVHGVASAPTYCMNPDFGEPGSPLFHITFNVKVGLEAGFAELVFSSEGAYDGHWNNCSGGQISPDPDYYDGGVILMGHACHITVGTDSVGPSDQAVVDVYLHNNLDVYEYFNRILYDDGLIDVDSIVAARGSLHYGNYPTHVSGDTIYVHGWAAGDDCLYADHSYPGAVLYRLYLTIDESAPPGYTIPLTYLAGGLTWDHWVGCDLGTTDSFTATDGWVYVDESSAVEGPDPASQRTRLEPVAPNPTGRGGGMTLITYYLGRSGHVTLTIYSSQGEKVRTLADGPRGAGAHRAEWDGTNDFGRDVASGAYFCTLETENASHSQKVVLAR